MSQYSSKTLAHYNSPHNAGALSDANIVGRGSLDSRAPFTEIYVKIENGIILRAGFTTFGCGASIACNSALTQLIIGKGLEECRNITGNELLDALDGLPSDKLYCAQIALAALYDVICQWSTLSGV